ncbi:unnamed protein product [Lathyrus sativus]|nr:unnamed protein product [Lathyrus sativus]
MGNCCKASSSMEWDGQDCGSLKSSSNKVFVEAVHLDHHQDKENDILEKLRASCDANGKVTLKISKSELAELLGAIQQNNDNQRPQKEELASAEQVLSRLMKARDQEIAEKHHCSSNWKPVLDTILE